MYQAQGNQSILYDNIWFDVWLKIYILNEVQLLLHTSCISWWEIMSNLLEILDIQKCQFCRYDRSMNVCGARKCSNLP